MANFILLPLLLLFILHVPCALSIPGISGLSTLTTASNHLQGITNKNNYIEVDGHALDLFADWRANLFDDKTDSTDISHKSFLLHFSREPVKGTRFTIVYEARTAKGVSKYYTVCIPVLKSDRKMTFTPSIYFPRKSLLHGRCLIFKIPEHDMHYEKVIMMDTYPHANVNQQKFDFNYWRLNQALSDERDLLERFTLQFDPSSFFQDARKKIMSADPSDLRNILSVLETECSSSSACEVTSNVLGRCTDPRAKLITAISREIVHASSGLFVGSAHDNRVLQILPHSWTPVSYAEARKFFRFVGRFIGIAIVNRLPVDLSFSSEILQSILNQDKNIIPYKVVVQGFFFGMDSQVNAQTEALCQGVWEVVPREYLAPFDDEQLGWIISGRPVVNVQSLKELARYQEDNLSEEGDAAIEESQLIHWFWNYVAKLSPEYLHTFIELVTESPRLPPLYYTDQWKVSRHSIQTKSGKPAKECFQIGVGTLGHSKWILIPPYPSPQILEDNFNQAIMPKSL